VTHVGRLAITAWAFWFASEAVAAKKCGIERQPVKTGTDADAKKVELRAIDTTIATLRGMHNPPRAQLPQNARVAPVELTLYTLRNVTLIYIKGEADGDYHMVLADENGLTMIAESPADRCMGASSPFRASAARARAAIEAALGKDQNPRKLHETITVAGIDFFDFVHGQTGVAPNGIEIHPVLAACFGKDCRWK
jgi:hypothetical protein